MVIAFRTKTLRTLASTESSLRKQFGPEPTEAFKACLADLRVAGTIADVPFMCVIDCANPVDGSAKAIRLGGIRLVIEANHVKNPKLPDGTVDWNRVERIKIIAIGRDDGQ